jgi:cytochrome c biogenesis protein CcmG/thiol:disulfide interchange protein DsbE
MRANVGKALVLALPSGLYYVLKELNNMAQKLGDGKKEQDLAKIQRKELKEELAEQYARLPRRPRNQRRIITFVVLGIIALLAGVFGLLVLQPSATQQSIAGVAIGTEAPNFTLQVYGGSGIGTAVNLSALRGHPVILNFWSESCTPCLQEVPYLEQFYSQYGAQRQFALLGINQADPKDDIAKFGDEYHVTYPLLFDKGGIINANYAVTAIPTTYFIDSRGIVRSAIVQPLTPQTMQQGLSSVGISMHP